MKLLTDVDNEKFLLYNNTCLIFVSAVKFQPPVWYSSEVYTCNMHYQCQSVVLCLDLPRTRHLQSVESVKAAYTSQAPTTARGVRIRKVSRTTTHAAQHTNTLFVLCGVCTAPCCLQYMSGTSSCGFIKLMYFDNSY